MTIRQAYQQLLLQLYEMYDDSEAANIANWVIEHVTGQKRIDRITYPDLPVTGIQQQQLEDITAKLQRNMPVQYVLKEAWFAGLQFYVDESVLIPRPETEELVQWVLDDTLHTQANTRSMLDIGTGSGCIPIALKKKLPKITARAVDLSEGALNVAVKNAITNGVQVYFIRLDFLDETTWPGFGRFHIITSNPPYVRLSEACTMSPNVLEYEPHLALFVPEEDPLLFYRKIAAFGKDHLEYKGNIYMEINEALGDPVVALFSQQGYNAEIRNDLQGKQRMVKATLL